MKTKAHVTFRVGALVAFTLLINVLISDAQATGDPVEFSVPFPKSSPRSSAAVVYCSPALNNELSASDSKLTSMSFVQWKARVRIMFSGTDILLSVADISADTQEEYRSVTRYIGTRPEPSDFAGNVYVSSDGNGQASVLAVSRDTGTFIWSRVSAGSPTGSYPSISTAFYVCGQRAQ